MQRRHIVWLIVGVSAISTSSILIRVGDDEGISPLAMAFYRCAMASAILLVIALWRYRAQVGRLLTARWKLALVAGLVLAGHFTAWFPSLSLTTVAASVVLVQTTPIWVALAAPLVGERVTRRGWLGIGVALAGTLVIAGIGFQAGAKPFLGDMLAVLGAIFAAAYVLCGRRGRQEFELVPYTAVVYGIGGVAIGILMVVTAVPFLGYSAKGWALFIAMTAGPQFLGHTVFNHLLGEVRASVVAVALLAEPIGATLLAYLILGEVPGGATIVGGAIVLTGIAIAVKAEARRTTAVLEQPVE